MEIFTCWTPSPPTSRSWWIPGTLPILSTSSRKTIPAVTENGIKDNPTFKEKQEFTENNKIWGSSSLFYLLTAKTCNFVQLWTKKKYMLSSFQPFRFILSDLNFGHMQQDMNFRNTVGLKSLKHFNKMNSLCTTHEKFTLLCFFYVVVGILQEFSNDRFNVFPNIASLSQGGAITDSKRDI